MVSKSSVKNKKLLHLIKYMCGNVTFHKSDIKNKKIY